MPTQAEKYAVAMAGEHYVAAELLRRGVAAAVTMGNAKRADVIAINHMTTRAVVIEVKSSPNKEWIVGSEPPVHSEQPWVFVHVPPDFSPPRFFILTASEIRDILLPGHEAYCRRYECRYGKPSPGGVCKLRLKEAETSENCWEKIISEVGA